MHADLLKELRTRRDATIPPISRYQEDTQTSQILDDGVWQDSWNSRLVGETKKCDIETGEDQKGT
ncbi:MAG: hypothetical protein OXK16_15795 [bacterium]|nr:hypothetical protein [bacterium]